MSLINSCMLCENTKCLRSANDTFSEEGMVCSYLDALYRCFNIQFLDNYQHGINRICGRCVAKLKYCCAFRKDVEAAHRGQYQIIDKTNAAFTTFYGNPAVLNPEWNQAKFDNKDCNLIDNPWNVCKMEDDHHSPYDGGDDIDLPSQYDCYDQIDSLVNCRIDDSPYRSDWSVDTDDILRTTGYFSEIKPQKLKFRNFKEDQSLCETCGKKFSNRQILQGHMLIHTGIRLICDYCGRMYYNKRNMSFHIRTRHLGFKARKCPECSTRFSHLGAKRKHLWEVHKKKTIRCKHCSKTFESKALIRNHMTQDHFNVSKVKCRDCLLVFLTNVELMDHMVMHTGVKDHHCQICFKSFARKKTLTQHMKTHDKVDNRKSVVFY